MSNERAAKPAHSLMKLDKFPIKRIVHFTHEWWVEPDLPFRRVSLVAQKRNLDPAAVESEPFTRRRGQIGKFEPSRRWRRYSTIGGIDAGYIVPLYSMREIARRYGLTQNTQRYWKKYILPNPLEAVRRRSTTAHHWSRFTLSVLDTVLRDLETRGYIQFTRYMYDHINLLHSGDEFLRKYYENLCQKKANDFFDKLGVHWD